MKFSTSNIAGRVALAGTILLTHVVFAHRVEANFWAQRADAVRRLRAESSTPSRGAGVLIDMLATPAAGLTTQGRNQPISSIFTESFPAPLRDEAADLLTALLPRATVRSYIDAGPDTPLVIHLQDVHGHVGAQRNMARLLSDIIRRRPEAPIFLEGGAGPIVLPRIGPVSAEAIRGTAAFFFNTHLISGAEVAALTAPEGSRIFGAEDPLLYLANVKAVREAELLREELSARLRYWRERAEMRADQMFNPALRVLNERSRKWESGAEGLSERAAFLWEHATAHVSVRTPDPARSRERGKCLDLNSNGKLTNSRECPELDKFIKASQAEKEMDLAAIQRDRLSLLTALEENISESTVTDLGQAALAFHSGAIRPGKFYRTLMETVRRSGLVLERYPAFESYARYVILADEIHPETLHREMEKLEGSLWNRLAQTTEERQLASLLRDLGLLEGLANLKLTPDEWAVYRDRSTEMGRLAGQLKETLGTDSDSWAYWAQTMAPFEQFYEFAEARNAALAENVNTVLSMEKTHRPLAVLVAGGFHSTGLAPIFAGQHFSVLTLSPKLDENGDRTPFDLFTRDRTPLEQLFESPRVTLAETLGLQPIGEEGRGRREAIENMGPRLARLLDQVKTAPNGVIVDPADPTLIVASPTSGVTDDQIREIAKGQPVKTNVSTTMDEEAESPTVSVFKRDKSGTTRILEWLRSCFPRIRGAFAVILSAGFLGLILIPMAHSPSAHAATFFSSGGTLHVTVEKGDNLWGVAKKALAAQGREVTNPRIAQLVQELAFSNNLSNPDKIQAGGHFVVPHQDPKIIQTIPGSTVSDIINPQPSGTETPRTETPEPAPKASPNLPSAKEGSVSPINTTFSSDLIKQWPVVLALAIGLLLAGYFIWWRPKDVDLSAVEKNDPRLKEWIDKLGQMNGITDSHRLESDYLLPLLNNLHALILNHQITPASLKDRDQVNKQIDTYRSIARLSRKIVLLLDQRVQDAQWNGNGTRDRIMDIREKIFLYQLYALKASHALVNASVAHWALSHYDKKTSWFERWQLGALLRTVRGVRTMIGTSVSGFKRTMFQDEPGADSILWDRAAGHSVTYLGNILVPGLYSDENKGSLSNVFDGLVAKAKTKNLPDISGKDLHRKGLSTMMGLLFWSAAISMTMSIGQATLAFLTGLGVNMLLFRLQSSGTRRDAFYRMGFAEWRELNKNRTHPNGRLKDDGTNLGEDPFHLNRDSIRFNFQNAKDALARELEAEYPSADLILLVAKNEEERTSFEERRTDVRLFRPGVPVIVLPLPEGQQGSLVAYATAALFPFSDEFKDLAEHTPHLKGRNPWDLRIGTLVSKSPHAADMDAPLRDLPGLPKHFDFETLADTTVFDLAMMNVYRATQDRAREELGGMGLRWADRAYIGPIRTGEGPGITLDTFWANRDEMERYKFGAVVATPGMPLKLIRMNNVKNTLHVLTEKHPGRTYDPANAQLDQYQGFSGEGFYALDEIGARAQKKFLTNLLKRYAKLKKKPPLNLSTNFLVPAQIAQRESSATLSQKITTYFSQNGLFSQSKSKKRKTFNLINAQRATAFATGTWNVRLNSNPVEGFFYGGASFSVDPEEGTSPSDGKSPDLGDKKSHWTDASRSVGALAVPLVRLVSGFAHLGAVRGILTSLSVPLLALWLLMSPVGLVASRISHIGTSVLQSYSKNRRGPSSQESLMKTPQDVTVQAWSRPEVDVAEFAAALTGLRTSSHAQAEGARRALARLALALIASAPLQNNFLEGLDVGKTRRIMQRAAPGVWAGDAKEEERLGAVGIIRRTALRSLAHQISVIRRRRTTNKNWGAALRQTGFLAGMAGLDDQTLEDVRALMDLLAGENGTTLLTTERWERAVEDGRKEQGFLSRSIKPMASNHSEESTFTALRVTELLPGTPGTAAQRQALIAGMKRRALRNQTGRDVLVVNGRIAEDRDAEAVRQSLQKRVKDPTLNSYLAKVKIVFVPEDRFPPESVLTQITPESSRFSMDLITVNPAAILVDPLRPNVSYRVLLLELLRGELRHVDLMDLARKAFQAARVVFTGA